MLARVDAGPDAGQSQPQPQQQQSLVVVKSLLSTSAHHQRTFEHEAEILSHQSRHTSDHHVVRLLRVCCSLQPPLIVTEYCELVCILHCRSLFSLISLTVKIETVCIGQLPPGRVSPRTFSHSCSNVKTCKHYS